MKFKDYVKATEKLDSLFFDNKISREEMILEKNKLIKEAFLTIEDERDE